MHFLRHIKVSIDRIALMKYDQEIDSRSRHGIRTYMYFLCQTIKSNLKEDKKALQYFNSSLSLSLSLGLWALKEQPCLLTTHNAAMNKIFYRDHFYTDGYSSYPSSLNSKAYRNLCLEKPQV